MLSDLPSSRAAFICGCGHSGTSLLANMFAAHPDVFIPLRETEIFLHGASATRRWSALLTEFEASGRALLVEKTPKHVRYLTAIRSTVLGSRFLVMVRDGRDVAASYIKRTGSALVGAERWLQDNNIVAAEFEAADVLVIRYEDLVAQPVEMLERACAFVGLTYAPQMLRYYELPRLWFGASEIAKGDGTDGKGHVMLRNWQINQPIFDDRGKWRQLLGSDDPAFFDHPEVRGLMECFGYT